MSTTIHDKTDNIVHATIDVIEYNSIKSSLIEASSLMGIKNNIWVDSSNTHKTAINAVDIDWNDTVINIDTNINTTSDLLKIVKNINKTLTGISLPDYNTQQDFGNKQYSIGLMTDVHYNDICAIDEQQEHYKSDSGNKYNPYEDLEYVLNFYKNENVDMICCAGDISTNDIEHVHSFKERVDNIVPNIPAFTCKGNHDNYTSYDHKQEWLQYTIPVEASPIFFTSGDQTSFYYNYNDDVYIYFNVDYNNVANATAGTLLSDGVSYQFYDPDTIIELQQILDNNRNKRCFIFTHQFLPNKAGNPWHDYTQNRSHNYCLSGYQFALLNEMNNYYKNSMWFSGHSHYQ